MPFIVFDPRDPASDHWQPLWGDRPAEVVARVLAGIETSEPYYADTLRMHVGVVASVLHAGGYWPPSLPLLVEASQCAQFDRVVALARAHQDTHPHLWRRVGHQAQFVSSKEGEKALGGGLVRLDLVMGEAWRSVLEPRTDPTDTPVGVNLAQAIRQRAVVLWRTHVDQMPDEAKTVTAVILNDIQACAVQAQADGPALWTCVLDEFGSVIANAAGPALALLQRGRTHEGQVHVITQSLADIEALTGQTGLLASMADNFWAFIVHRQTAPESRDWAAKLMGTDALWQSTDQTHAYAATGAGSRRRVRQFRVSSDTFAELTRRPSRRAHDARTATGRLPRQGTHAAHRYATADRRRSAQQLRDDRPQRHPAPLARHHRGHQRRHGPDGDVGRQGTPHRGRRPDARPAPRPGRACSMSRPPTAHSALKREPHDGGGAVLLDALEAAWLAIRARHPDLPAAHRSSSRRAQDPAAASCSDTSHRTAGKPPAAASSSTSC